MNIPHLLVISTVWPFPRKAGQQQRVYYTLKALRECFHVTFLTVAPDNKVASTHTELLEYCDEAIVLQSQYDATKFRKAWHKLLGTFYTLWTGLKFSNYLVGQVEFTPERLDTHVENLDFACVLYEYWHASETPVIFQKRGIPCILDMHNILWQSYARQLAAKPYLPEWWRDWRVAQYKRHEERAWEKFDALISINAAEHESVRSRMSPSVPIFYAPMGTDLSSWPYSWSPVEPRRVAYYGGLGSPHNQKDALFCYEQIMPEIWRQEPSTELWLVGSNPPEFLQQLSRQDSRVVVTDFVPIVQDVLKTMTAILCPWSGTYGFRSRLVEVMALGIPVIASPDAVYGMGMDDKKGIFLEETSQGMVAAVLKLFQDTQFAQRQSRLARSQMEEKFSYEATYGRLTRDLYKYTFQKSEKGLGL